MKIEDWECKGCGACCTGYSHHINTRRDWRERSNNGEQILIDENGNCPFLTENHTCSTYNDQPCVCSSFPKAGSRCLQKILEVLRYQPEFFGGDVDEILDMVKEAHCEYRTLVEQGRKLNRYLKDRHSFTHNYHGFSISLFDLREKVRDLIDTMIKDLKRAKEEIK